MTNPRHVAETKVFTRSLVEQLIERAESARRQPKLPPRFEHNVDLMFVIFWQPSTRTRFSFQVAGHRLGLGVIDTENAAEFSSTIKGETLEDTILILNEYGPRLIVMRHNEIGAAIRAAAVSGVPIINAGDGAGQHPTQALLDVYTIKRELGRLDDLTIVIGGDLAYGRTVRSLAYLLSKFSGIRIVFVAPRELTISDDIKQHLRECQVRFTEEADLAKVIGDADVLYWTRIQKENLPPHLQPQFAGLQRQYVLGPKQLLAMKPEARILHPFPRNAEIPQTTDGNMRAAYFRQAGNGLWIRQALLDWVLEE